MNEWIDRCHFGDTRDVLRRMAADGVKVQTIVTSPPYWGLRSYLPVDHPNKALEMGSEPTLREFIDTMVGMFDLCRDVLADDGTMWVNMGDSYAGSWGSQGREYSGVGVSALSARQVAASQRKTSQAGAIRDAGIKPKDLMGQPWRLAFALQDAGWWLRQDIIWHKPNPMPESIRDRCTKAHEYIFLLSKSEKYFYDFEAMQEPVSGTANARRSTIKAPDGWASHEGGHGSFHKEGREKGKTVPDPGVGRRVTKVYPGNGVGFGHGYDEKPKPRHVSAPVEVGAYGDGKSDRLGRGPGWRKLAEAGSGTKLNESYDAAIGSGELVSTRNRRSVWTVPSEPFKGAHFATFPRALIEPCILAGAPVGGIVLDPFFGSGTTGQVAQALGRHFIGIELNEANEPLQRGRLQQPSLRFA